MSTTFRTNLSSPIGTLRLLAADDGLTAVLLPEQRVTLGDGVDAPDHPVLEQARRELEAYFAGTLTTFSTPLRATGTPFQKSVWNVLSAIPAGETTTYAEIARRIGRPSAVRAVGAANGRNPIPIIVPCHRVIGTNGTLTGYAGGLATKSWLLNHERQAGSQMTTGISRSVQDWYVAKSA